MGRTSGWGRAKYGKKGSGLFGKEAELRRCYDYLRKEIAD